MLPQPCGGRPRNASAPNAAPKGTATFIAATLAADPGLLSKYNASTLVPELLGHC
jgi:hypothetical protein